MHRIFSEADELMVRRVSSRMSGCFAAVGRTFLDTDVIVVQ